METMLQDVKYALRQLGRQPSFSILAGLTLALGIGVSTALFSVIDAALLRPLPYPNPEQLVTIDVEETGKDGKTVALRAVDGRHPHLASAARRSSRMPGWDASPAPRRSIVDTGTPERLTVGEASEDFLETYGITPILGRGIQRGRHARTALRPSRCSATPTGSATFGGDPNVLGRAIRIQNEPGDDRRRAAGRLLQGDGGLAGEAVQRRP